ncbi:MAG: hypothetical protein HOO89_08970 [Ferruginibacter sp.]|nr:hypothetical protein [Ferruginibacter sp.]
MTSRAQSPVFSNDTLYTSCGYKIYRGQVLHFGKGTARKGNFNFVNIKNDVFRFKLTDKLVYVTKVWNFGISTLGNAYIEIWGVDVSPNSEREYLNLHFAFDNAIGYSKDTLGELLVPDDYRNNIKPKEIK